MKTVNVIAGPNTARLYLNMTVNSGYLLDVISYSFRHRSSPTGYANYNIYNIFVGSGSIFVSSSTTLQTTGTVNVANAIAGISGTVTVRLDLYNRVGPLTQGTFRMDDFVLNGYTTTVENWNPAGNRYGFQNQEKDSETGLENYKYRMHDPRVGRFFAVDPLAPRYPHNSPFAFSENRVINCIELEGLESELANLGLASNKGTGFLIIVMSEDMLESARATAENTLFDYMFVSCAEDGLKYLNQYMTENNLKKLYTLALGEHGGNAGIKMKTKLTTNEIENSKVYKELYGTPIPEFKTRTLDFGVIDGLTDGSYQSEGARKAYDIFFAMLAKIEENGNFGFAYGDIEFNNVCLIEGEFPSVENYNDWNKIYGENDVFEKLVAANISFEEFEEKWKYTLRLMKKQ